MSGWTVKPQQRSMNAAWINGPAWTACSKQLFASQLTGKRAGVVIYDTDGREGRIEYRIRVAAQAAGIRYTTYNLKRQK